MLGTLCFATSSLVQAPSQCQCTGLIYWHRKQVAGANINATISVASSDVRLSSSTQCPAIFASPLRATASPTFPPTSHLNPQPRLKTGNRSLLGYQLELSGCNTQTSRDQFMLVDHGGIPKTPSNAMLPQMLKCVPIPKAGSNQASSPSSGSTSSALSPISCATLLTTPFSALHAGLSGYASKKLSP